MHCGSGVGMSVGWELTASCAELEEGVHQQLPRGVGRESTSAGQPTNQPLLPHCIGCLRECFLILLNLHASPPLAFPVITYIPAHGRCYCVCCAAGIIVGCIAPLKSLLYSPHAPLRVLSEALETLGAGLIPTTIPLLGAVLYRCGAGAVQVQGGICPA